MKLYSEACARNEIPIGDELATFLTGPDPVTVWEIGSGTGQHAAAFARRFPRVDWQPSDRPNTLSSIESYRNEAGLDNLLSPLPFDLFDEKPAVAYADLVVSINVIHIAPFAATERLFWHAAEVLPPGGRVFLYGPYRYKDRQLEPSNARFDEFLRHRDPDSGVRLFEEVDEMATSHGFRHHSSTRLPANNDAHWWVL